ncbi:ATP-binding cassette domain-containing protein [Acidithiobacillus thiooxidans]|uniref:ATP-binding cassette domain-containing protein n=1 Tax=Acidithiobacillus thiooxidans TaxID=930 RepID=UPI0028643F49|nr:ATP-binding cassette domain-containing protein [Acidithiobacillus thiooxidans]MDR7926559.1 ATP-binding cassette domain-containing protein [Acidithiobacillus thiooxidans]
MSAWLEVKNLDVRFDLGEGGLLRQSQGSIHALSDIDFGLEQGQTVGLIGESGSGKSTLGRAILHLVRPTAGSVHFNGTNLTALREKQMRPYRQQMQMVFQDPFDSMNARMTVGQIIMEPLLLQGIGTSGERRQKAEALLRPLPGTILEGNASAHCDCARRTTEPQLLAWVSLPRDF